MAHELGVAEIRSFLDTAETSDSLEHKLYKVGSLIFAYGKEQRVLVLNPFDEIDRPKVAYTVPEILEPAQFKRLLEAAEEEVPELIPFLAMAGFAGVRRSELVKEYAEDQVLDWEDVDWQKQLIAVRHEVAKQTREKWAIDGLFRWKPRYDIGLVLIGKRRGFSFPWWIARSDDE